MLRHNWVIVEINLKWLWGVAGGEAVIHREQWQMIQSCKTPCCLDTNCALNVKTKTLGLLVNFKSLQESAGNMASKFFKYTFKTAATGKPLKPLS